MPAKFLTKGWAYTLIVVKVKVNAMSSSWPSDFGGIDITFQGMLSAHAGGISYIAVEVADPHKWQYICSNCFLATEINEIVCLHSTSLRLLEYVVTPNAWTGTTLIRFAMNLVPILKFWILLWIKLHVNNLSPFLAYFISWNKQSNCFHSHPIKSHPEAGCLPKIWFVIGSGAEGLTH